MAAAAEIFEVGKTETEVEKAVADFFFFIIPVRPRGKKTRKIVQDNVRLFSNVFFFFFYF